MISFKIFVISIQIIRYFYRKTHFTKGSILFVGQCYYNNWYLSRSLRELGWKADVLNWDPNENNRNMYYHGEDIFFKYDSQYSLLKQLLFFYKSLVIYDFFHFSNAHGMCFGGLLQEYFKRRSYPKILDLIILIFNYNWYASKWIFSHPVIEENYNEIKIIKKFNKKIVYTNNGCLDGVSQTSFSKWGKESVCDICIWKSNPDVCSDNNNLKWGKFRNEISDYQILLGGNRIDYNVNKNIHEVPGFYCLDPDFWKPDLEIPEDSILKIPPNIVKLYHAVGNFDTRTSIDAKNIKCSHIYLPLIDRLKKEGYPVELVFAKNIPNREVRYLQVQADIFLEMLTYGFFGANVREAMMLGKPVICYLRPEWLDQMREEIPEYVDELPIVNATPETVYDVLVDLITHSEKRMDIGFKSREFAVKWHSNSAGAKVMESVYLNLLNKSGDINESN